MTSDNDNLWSRRRAIKTGATLGIAGLAGCSQNGNGDGGGGNGDGGGGNGDGGGGGSDDFPSREVEVMVPWGAGGATDVQYRGIKSYFEDSLGVGTVVDNRGGAAGRQGMNYWYDQEANGYLVATQANITSVLGELLFDTNYTMEDIEAVGTYSTQFFAWVSAPGEFENFEEIVQAGNAGDLSYATVGRGTTMDFTAVSSLDTTGMDVGQLSHVPYDTSADCATAAARGDVDIGCTLLPSITGLLEDDTVEVNLVIREDQSPLAPDAQIISDVDYDIPLFSLAIGMWAPPGTPSERVSTLEDALMAATESSEYQSWAEEQGTSILGLNAQETRDQLDQIRELGGRYTEIVDV